MWRECEFSFWIITRVWVWIFGHVMWVWIFFFCFQVYLMILAACWSGRCHGHALHRTNRVYKAISLSLVYYVVHYASSLFFFLGLLCVYTVVWCSIDHRPVSRAETSSWGQGLEVKITRLFYHFAIDYFLLISASHWLNGTRDL